MFTKIGNSGQALEWVTARPCPSCGHDGWCDFAETGDGTTWVVCYRPAESRFDESDAFNLRESGKGEYATFLLDADGTPIRPGGREAAPGLPARITRHDVYTALLAALPLADGHRDDLIGRGLGEAHIDQGGYRTLTLNGRAAMVADLVESFGRDSLLTVPGFADGEDGISLIGQPGLLIPARDVTGRVVALKIRRVLEAGDTGSKYVYLSGKGSVSSGSPVHVPLGVTSPAPVCRVTEGELKADVAHRLSGLPTVSVPGVGPGKNVIDTLRTLGAATVHLAYDADCQTNPTVGAALYKTFDTLTDAGFAVSVETWEGESKGIDDALKDRAPIAVLPAGDTEAFVDGLREKFDPARLLAKEAIEVVNKSGWEALHNRPTLMGKVSALKDNNPGGFALLTNRVRSAGVPARGWASMLKGAGGGPDDVPAEGARNDAQLLQSIAGEGELFHTRAGKAFATVPVGDHRETYPLAGVSFKRWLKSKFFDQTGRTPNPETFRGAVDVLDVRAVSHGPEHEVHVRTAPGPDGSIYLDLANPGWEAVRVTPGGWEVVSDPPVKFRRSQGTLALPTPERGGGLDDLRAFVNLPNDDDWTLYRAWLCAAVSPHGPFPVLILNGEQGSAKSTASAVARRLTDDHESLLRSVPKEETDIWIAASNSGVLALDNLSYVPGSLADTLCRIATGAGTSKRELYTDDGEIHFRVKKPILMNGIDDATSRPDLLDRAILLTLPVISDADRRDEATFWAAFDDAHPRLLGALLDAVAGGLRYLAAVRAERRPMPRMADFALWAEACSRASGAAPGAFLAVYSLNRRTASIVGLEGSPIATAVIRWISGMPLKDGLRTWVGTSEELLAFLNTMTPLPERGKHWPESARGMSGALRRNATGLRPVGIDVVFPTGRVGHDNRREITVTKTDRSQNGPENATGATETPKNATDATGCDRSQNGQPVALKPLENKPVTTLATGATGLPSLSEKESNNTYGGSPTLVAQPPELKYSPFTPQEGNDRSHRSHRSQDLPGQLPLPFGEADPTPPTPKVSKPKPSDAEKAERAAARDAKRAAELAAMTESERAEYDAEEAAKLTASIARQLEKARLARLANQPRHPETDETYEDFCASRWVTFHAPRLRPEDEWGESISRHRSRPAWVDAEPEPEESLFHEVHDVPGRGPAVWQSRLTRAQRKELLDELEFDVDAFARSLGFYPDPDHVVFLHTPNGVLIRRTTNGEIREEVSRGYARQ